MPKCSFQLMLVQNYFNLILILEIPFNNHLAGGEVFYTDTSNGNYRLKKYFNHKIRYQ
jgi:hypothetical protein